MWHKRPPVVFSMIEGLGCRGEKNYMKFEREKFFDFEKI